MSILKKLITFTKKIGYRTAKVFGYIPREEPIEYIRPEKEKKRPARKIKGIPKDLQAAKRARKAQRTKMAYAKLQSARKAAANAIRHEAHARLARKRYEHKIIEKREYGLGLTYTARTKRRRIRRAELEAIEKVSKAKRTLLKRDRDYKAFLKKKAWRKAEFEKKWSKTAAKIRYEAKTAFSWQMVFSAQFICPERKEPTKRLEGYSGVRFTRERKPCLAEQEDMKDEAIRWIQAQNLDGNSECEPVESTVIVNLRRRDLKREGEAMRQTRLDKEAAEKVLRAWMKREKARKKRMRGRK